MAGSINVENRPVYPAASRAAGALQAALPRAPVLDWSSFGTPGEPSSDSASVQDLESVVYATSGRAAIFQALKQLALPSGSRVLVPSYHCPTMVAPVLQGGLQPAYFGLMADGLPDLAALDASDLSGVRVIIVAHYFGLPRSLAAVRQWCDGRGIVMIEDCAHCFFGQAGERPVGAWGDFATASLAKFFPVPEAGLLGSARRTLAPLGLRAPGLRAQLKGAVDVLELAHHHRRLAGLRPLLALIFGLKNRRVKDDPAPASGASLPLADIMMRDCDMGRIGDAPLAVSKLLDRLLPRPRVMARRHENFARYLDAFAAVGGARPLFEIMPPAAAPYVFPLWVDDADRVYQATRDLRLPIFRWDRIWPGTPSIAGDVGPRWSRHVLQLLCHQDLSIEDIDATIAALLQLIHLPARAPAKLLCPTAPDQQSAGVTA